jgi:ribosome-associated protein
VSGPGRLEKARLILAAALDRKAEDAVVLDVRQLCSFTDTFVLLTGRSDRQVRAIADAVAEALGARGEVPLGVEGYEEGRWVLMDLNDAIVHVFLPDVRELYDLERLWSDAPRIERGDSAGPAEAGAETRRSSTV